MNRLIICALLTSCAAVPSNFDYILYDHLVELSVNVSDLETKCGTSDYDSALKSLMHQSKILVQYTTFSSKDVNKSVMLIDEDLSKLGRNKSSVAFCKFSLDFVSIEMNTLLKGFGEKTK